MNKFWKQTMALYLAFALVFGTLVPVVAWAEEPANVEEPIVASKPEAPAEKETQAESEESLTEEETEGKETEAPGELELSEGKTPDAQGEPASGKLFTLTKRPVGGSSQEDILIGEYDTFYKVTEECAKHQNDKTFLYIITMHGDYTIPADENVYTLQYVNTLLQSEEGKQYTLKRLGTRLVTYVAGECELETKNIIFDGNNDGEFTFISEGGKLTLGEGTVLQNFIDVPATDGPAIHMVGSSTLNIEPGAVIRNNKADQKTKYSGVIYAQDTCTVNIRGGEFTNNSCDTSGGVIGSGSRATVNIYDGTFKYNTAEKAGGVINAYGTINISGGTFEGNEAASGGAIYANKASIQKAEFLSNKATWGGAVFIAGEATIQNSVFTSNTASSAGGALYVSGVTKIANSEFQSNNSKQGGAIYSKGELNVADTSFTQNEANDGGAVLAIAKMTLTGDTFTSNKATELGGAVVIADVAEITKSKFESNEAQNGGAIYTQETTTINGTGFASNKAEVHGGAIYVDALLTDRQGNVTKVNADLKVKIGENTKFESNKAGKEGGAIYTMPYQYKDPIDKNHTGEPVAEQHPYENLDIDDSTFFNGNQAYGGLFVPPTNHQECKNLKFDSKSDVTHGKLKVKSLLNNYDVNYKGKEPTETAEPSEPSTPSRDERIIVDPNGGTFSDGTTGRKTYLREIGETFVLPAAPTREGYKFVAWEGKSGTYQPGDKYTVKRGGDVFTARWEEEKKPEEKPSVKPNIKTPKGSPLTPDEIAKILAGMKKTVPAIPRAGVGK